MARIKHREYDYIFASDVHIGERKDLNVPTASGLNSRLLEGISIVDQIGELAKKYKVRNIFILGDIFDLKDRIPARIMILFAEAVAKFPCPLIILKGNHDYAEDDYAPIKLLKREGKLSLIDAPNIYNDIVFLPYYRKYEEFRQKWIELHKEMKMKQKIRLFLFHNTVPGAKFANNRKAEGEFDLPTMGGVRYLAGDIHLPQNVGPIKYLGSPYQVDFGEEGQDKFVYLYKVSEDSLVPVELNYPKFVSIDVNSQKVLGGIEGNYVRMIGEVLKEDKERIENIKKNIQEMNPKFVISAVKYRADKKARIVTAKDDHQAVLSEFLGQSETELDKQRLLEVGLDLIKEVQS